MRRARELGQALCGIVFSIGLLGFALSVCAMYLAFQVRERLEEPVE